MGILPANTTERTALVTGITGQDGSYLAEWLLEKGYKVHGLSRKAVEPPSLHAALAVGRDRITLHSCNVIDYNSVCQLMRVIRPDEVYNLAAQSHVGLSFKQPELTAAVSGLGVVNLLEAIQEAGLADRVRYFEASSCEIFGQASGEPLHEDSPLHPQTPYGKSKLLAFLATKHYSWQVERRLPMHPQMPYGKSKLLVFLAIKHYRESYGMYACSGILFNHESPRRGEYFVTRKITQAAVNIKLGKQEAVLLGNLDAQRDWGHARDYVHCMWLMLQQQKPADFIIGTGINTSVRQFVELAFECVDLPVRWEGPKGIEEVGVLARGPDAGRVLVTICAEFFRPLESTIMCNPSKASTELGWRRDITLRQLVAEMVNADMATARDAQAQH